MAFNNFEWKNSLTKIFLIIVVALLMLIPLGMIRIQINERSAHHDQSVRDITANWGSAQTFSGPWISYKYLREPRQASDKEKDVVKASLYPDSLKYIVNTHSQELHRSIYDVSVYNADITILGNFVLDERFPGVGVGDLVLNMDGLKGIQGKPEFVFGGKELKVKATEGGLRAELTLDGTPREGDIIPFQVTLKINGSESLFFRPAGNMTEVEMTSDYPDPSFSGDFLPVERQVSEEGFTARWSISQVTLASPSTTSFGVNLIKPVTQYRQTERAVKYGILVILLIFIAGFVVEMVSKKPINIIQYLVIGASLVLFYSLLLAFSDFLSFGLSYLIAAAMTTISLGAYFLGIVKNKWAWLLTGLVALAYGVIYVLLQMETYAFLAGTLLLFVLLCVIMYLTRSIPKQV